MPAGFTLIQSLEAHVLRSQADLNDNRGAAVKHLVCVDSDMIADCTLKTQVKPAIDEQNYDTVCDFNSS